MKLEIFDVEHGACALLTCDNNTRIMIDCGHNATTNWRPGSHLKRAGISRIEMLTVTNYDEDHVSGIEDLFEHVSVGALLRNKSVAPNVLRNLKSDTGMGRGIDALCYHAENTFTGPPTDMSIFQGLSQQVFWNSYPKFDDENNLSLAVFMKCNGVTVLFPGDMESAGWNELLKLQSVIDNLRDTKVLIAPHHGRLSGWTDKFRNLCAPYYVVISDKGYMHETQETVPLYRSIARGAPFRVEPERRVLTTRNDGKITFQFDTGGWSAF